MMPVEISKSVKVSVTVTGFDLGREFAKLHSEEQAQFFNGVASETNGWVKSPAFQWQYMRDDMEGLPAALAAFKSMAEYAEDTP